MIAPEDKRGKYRALKKEKKALIQQFWVAHQVDLLAHRKESVRLEALASKDSLTGLDNRTSIHRIYIDHIIARQEASLDFRNEKQKELGLMAVANIDVDRFKLINDTYGHDVGDEALRHVASILQMTARSEDIPFRISGDEMGVLYPNVESLEEAMAAAERARKEIAKTPFITKDGQQINLTSSFGVAIINPEIDRVFNDASDKADKAMYHSKKAGRNCVTGLSIEGEVIESNGLHLPATAQNQASEKVKIAHEVETYSPQELMVGSMHEQFKAVKQEITKQKEINVKLEQSIRYDGLTKLHKRPAAEEKFKRLQSKVIRQKSKAYVGVLVLDINAFKQVNDTHGHIVGDKVLQHFATHIQKQIRHMDIDCRWGGEEFVVALQSSSASGATRLAKRIEQALDKEPFKDGDLKIPYKVSIGVSVHQPLKKGAMMLDDAMKPADKAMYAAKEKAKSEDYGTRIARIRRSGKVVFYTNHNRGSVDPQEQNVRARMLRQSYETLLC